MRRIQHVMPSPHRRVPSLRISHVSPRTDRVFSVSRRQVRLIALPLSTSHRTFPPFAISTIPFVHDDLALHRRGRVRREARLATCGHFEDPPSTLGISGLPRSVGRIMIAFGGHGLVARRPFAERQRSMHNALHAQRSAARRTVGSLHRRPRGLICMHRRRVSRSAFGHRVSPSGFAYRSRVSGQCALLGEWRARLRGYAHVHARR
ncbi:hypothetical protein BD626DRAFT_171255 [Schizophyllum amplum]|uniref:Uncharacterized protein n=1 Tax=Schizophyllum amplum TaxID=97359 RepID=A0A550CR48_9AGAR|nr:hypothetical protein BD626DRAFT_171255 [Auriculariopsis ampla]